MGYDWLSIGVFAVAVVILLILDLKFVGRKEHEVTTKEAGIWTIVFVLCSLAYAGFLHWEQGAKKSMEFLTAYAIEKTLSVDNLFVFILIFKYFKVPKIHHHKVLFYGIMGALVLRAIFIFSGSALIELTYFNWLDLKINVIITIFGAVLIWKGIGAAKEALGDDDDEEEKNFSDSPGARFVSWITGGKLVSNFDGDKFFTSVKVGDKIVRYGTLLLVVVGVVEFTDLVFAVDSIPAIFSVTQDKMILYTSNIFAILGLRSMYFLLANLLPLFRYLNHGLAIILTFIGFKMVASPFFHIEGTTSLYIVLGILATSIIISLLNKKTDVEEAK